MVRWSYVGRSKSLQGIHVNFLLQLVSLRLSIFSVTVRRKKKYTRNPLCC
uniref:Uncharacterized protein n=1 Tax=Aegilops tauschii subsp. strangulata TaxID=200361 RepID=A0A453IC66_AEGTS